MSWLQHFARVHSVLKYAGMFPPVVDIQEALALVIRYHIKSEIIDSWLYCYPNPLIGFQLELIRDVLVSLYVDKMKVCTEYQFYP